MSDVYKKSLDLHKEKEGKMEIKSKVSLSSKEDLSLAYTPGVAEVCREIAKNPELAYQYTIKKNSVAVITDGSAVLGLGNLGPEAALPVMEGKAILFKEFANINAFPICLDTQEPEEIVDAVIKIAPVFGGINLEDIGSPKCFWIEQELRKRLKIPVMHDDQHGTSTVVLAGLINSIKLAGLKKEEVKIVMSGAGAAGTAVAKLLLEYGFKNLVMVDSKGAIYKGRGNLNKTKEELANLTNIQKEKGNLEEVIKSADIFVGVSRAGLLTQEMIKSMNNKPIIFALANPEPEIMPAKAKEAGAFIVSTGRSDFPNQVNNVLAFPGIFRYAFDNKIDQFTNKQFICAARALAEHVKDLSVDKIIPDPLDKTVTNTIATAMCD